MYRSASAPAPEPHRDPNALIQNPEHDPTELKIGRPYKASQAVSSAIYCNGKPQVYIPAPRGPVNTIEQEVSFLSTKMIKKEPASENTMPTKADMGTQTSLNGEDTNLNTFQDLANAAMNVLNTNSAIDDQQPVSQTAPTANALTDPFYHMPQDDDPLLDDNAPKRHPSETFAQYFGRLDTRPAYMPTYDVDNDGFAFMVPGESFCRAEIPDVLTGSLKICPINTPLGSNAGAHKHAHKKKGELKFKPLKPGKPSTVETALIEGELRMLYRACRQMKSNTGKPGTDPSVVARRNVLRHVRAGSPAPRLKATERGSMGVTPPENIRGKWSAPKIRAQLGKGNGSCDACKYYEIDCCTDFDKCLYLGMFKKPK